MPTLRDFLGSTCTRCRKDILQQAPSNNRMPDADLAWCPTCKVTMTVDELSRGPRRGPGVFARLFSRPHRG